MELEIKRTIYVDLDEIIEWYGLDKNSTDEKIHDAVTDEICGWEDSEYYLFGNDEVKAVCAAIAEKLHSEPTAEDWEDFWREN